MNKIDIASEVKEMIMLRCQVSDVLEPLIKSDTTLDFSDVTFVSRCAMDEILDMIDRVPYTVRLRNMLGDVKKMYDAVCKTR